jgi:hypothetical protein
MIPTAFALIVATTCSPSPNRLEKLPEATQSIDRSYWANDLYSRQARRRMARYLRLRLTELNLERLDRVEKVLRGALPIDELLREP